jgi:putative ATPase
VVELEINRHLDSNCSIGVSKSPSISSKNDNLKSMSLFSQKKRPIEQSSSSIPIPATGDSTSTQLLTVRPYKRQKTSVVNTGSIPLAERLRPKEFPDFIGQEHLIGPDSLLVHLLQGSNGSAGSMILWGPSGCGKTTLARLLANQTDAILKEVSATSSGMNEVRQLVEEAKGVLSLTGR